MTIPDWNLQVKIGRGRSNTGAHHRAMEIARQLLAIGRCPGCLDTLIIIYKAYDTHRQLQLSGPGSYNPAYNIIVYPTVYELKAGWRYKIVPMSDSFRQWYSF